jgi:hypothetical protein
LHRIPYRLNPVAWSVLERSRLAMTLKSEHLKIYDRK